MMIKRVSFYPWHSARRQQTLRRLSHPRINSYTIIRVLATINGTIDGKKVSSEGRERDQGWGVAEDGSVLTSHKCPDAGDEVD